MGVKCRISYDNAGTARVLDSRGRDSELYSRLLAQTGNQKEALDYWVIANDKGFMDKEDATISDIMAYLDATSAIEKTLSPAERLQVTDFMKRNGIESLDDLNSTFSEIFKPEGILDINITRAVDSGLFTAEEVRSLNLNQLQDIMLKMEGQVAVENIFVEPTQSEYKYINNERSTIFGTKVRVSQEELDSEIIQSVENFTTKESFYEGIKNLPYTEFVEKFMNDDEYAQSIMNEFKDLKKIPVLSIVNDELSDSNNRVYVTVKNTVLTEVDGLSIQADIEYLNSIPQDIWDDSAEDIQQVLREVEEELAKFNIDVVGISEKYGQREKVMDLLMKSFILTQSVTPSIIESFAESHNSLIETPGKVVSQKLDEVYTPYNIVSLHSNKTENELFEKYGLIKVADNLYHNVDQDASLALVKDVIYQGLLDGTIEVPSEFITVKDVKNPEVKIQVLEGISTYLMSRPTPVSHNNHELYSGYQVAFNHSEIKSKRDEVRGLTEIKTDEEYLKTDFVSDFYGYILREKAKRSEIYNNVLSKFEINDKDISLISPIESIENLEYSEELADYIRLKRDSDMKYLVDDTEVVLSEDLFHINFPELKSEYEGRMIKEGDFIITSPTIDDYIKVDGEMYRKEASREDAEFFVKITTPQNPVYYSSSQNFDFNREQGVTLFNLFGMLDELSTTDEQFLEIISKSRMNDNMDPKLKKLSTLKDKSYTFTEGFGSFSAIKNGEEVGRINFNMNSTTIANPIVRVKESHRGKGIGTELYLHLFDKAFKSGRTVNKPVVETKQSINIFARVEGVKKPDIKFQISKQSKYIPFSFQPNTNSLNKEEFDTMMDDLRNQKITLLEYLDFVLTMQNEDVYKGIYNKLVKPNLDKLNFTVAQNEILNFEDTNNRDLLKAQKFVSFYEKYRDEFPSWANQNEKFYREVVQYLSGGHATKLQQGVGQQEVVTPTEVLDSIANSVSSGVINVEMNPVVSESRFNALKKLGRIKEDVDINSINGFQDSFTAHVLNKSANTLVHEGAHIWYMIAENNKPEILNRAKEDIKSTEYYKNIEESSIYKNMSPEAKVEEAIIQMIGDKGQKLLDSKKDNNLKTWLAEFWDYIKSIVGLYDYEGDVQNLTLDQFTEMAAVDVIRGKTFSKLDNFEEFVGDSRVVSGTEIGKIKTGEPVVVKGYHGTTHEFYTFDSSQKGTVQGHLGKMNYFTSDKIDAQENYGLEGPDLNQRIETLSERITQDVIELNLFNPETGFLDREGIANLYNIDLSQVPTSDFRLGLDLAREMLHGGKEQVLELWLKLNNPVVLGDAKSYYDIYEGVDLDEYMGDAVDYVAEMNDVTTKEARDDYNSEVIEKAIELSGVENPLWVALDKAISDNTFDYTMSEMKTAEVLGEFWESEVDLTELETEIRKTLGYETDEEGEIVTSQIVSDFFKNLGYDSIIIDNVSKRFNFMSGVSNTTSHIHIFDDFSNQIKLADDTNVTYNIESRDIRFQIVGESAILESTIRDNLDVAMTMENSGKTETQIKQSTGWERGSEGKWRYEITDLTESQWGKISEYVLNNAGRRDDIDELTRIAKDGYNKNLLEEGGLASDFEYMIGKYVQIKFKDKLKLTLSDLSPMFDNVIKVYPELAGMEVKKSSTVTMATYTPSENSIKINIDGILYDQKNPYYHLATSLHHEVQHKIQDIEGFEQGASPQMRTPKARKAINEIIENTESLRAANPLISNRDEPLEALNDFYEYAKSEYFSSTPIEERRKIGTLSEGIKNFLSVDYKGSINKVNLLLDSIAKFEDTQSKLGFENYLKVAGEVEARNVQRRMALNQNQRIDIALKDTEDVYRDNQISYSDVSGYTELEVGSKLGSFYNTRENIENTSSIFDSRLELLDLYSSKEEVDINEQLDCG